MINRSLFRSTLRINPMRTVSTKLDNVDHDKLLEICNKEGKLVSEFLREFIQDCCRAYDEEEEEPEQEQAHTSKPIPNKTAQYKVVLYPDMPKGQDQVTKVSYDGGKTWH